MPQKPDRELPRLLSPAFRCAPAPVARNNKISLIRRDSFNLASRVGSLCGTILPVMDGVKTIIKLLGNLARFLWLSLRPQCALAAENLFLRKQLAMFQERKAKPSRLNTQIRIALVLLSRLFRWRDTLVVVQPQALVRWHRQGFRLFWRWKSRPGRPRHRRQAVRLCQ
jgi:hypothetical protein